MFAECWGCIRAGGIIFSLLLLPGVPWWGFPRLFAFCWGTRKMIEAVFHFLGLLGESWGLGCDAAVGFLGVGVVGCVFVLDMVLVTYN